MNDFPQPKFDVTEEDVGDTTRILDAAGEIHVSTAPRFSERLNAAIADGKTALVLDFSRVEFIDSTGLRLCEITRLDSTFDIVGTRDEALQHVANGTAGGAPESI